MPDTSDSEAFESADEDFVDQKAIQVKRVSDAAPVPDKEPQIVATLDKPAPNVEEVAKDIGDENQKDIKKQDDPKKVSELTLKPKPEEQQTPKEVVDTDSKKTAIKKETITKTIDEPKKSPEIKTKNIEDENVKSNKVEFNTSPEVKTNTKVQDKAKTEIAKHITLPEDKSKKQVQEVEPSNSDKSIKSPEVKTTSERVLAGPVPTASTTKKEEVAEPVDDDGWEFDDWGEDAPTPAKADAPTPEKHPEEDDEVGWEVEDWDDEIPAASPKSTKATSKPSSNFSKMTISEQPSDDKAKPSLPIPANPLDRLTSSNDSTSNWGWKQWGGVKNLLSTATDGVASITSHVSSVIESGIGVPDPAEMARIQQQERQKRLQEQPAAASSSADGERPVKETSNPRRGDDASLFLGHFVSGVTNISNRVITGGLDTLEGIGKKTMTILKENDQGLLSKQRQMMMDGQGPVLSQVSSITPFSK